MLHSMLMKPATPVGQALAGEAAAAASLMAANATDSARVSCCCFPFMGFVLLQGDPGMANQQSAASFDECV